MSVVTQPMESAAMRAVIAERDAAVDALTNGIGGAVSVVIPCYQQSHYLNTALESVQAQTVAPLEVIVVDDGSDPTHAETIKALCDHHEARYVRVTNRGLPSARNTGLMLARGEWFLPLDADDWLDPRYIELTLAEADRSKADVILTGLQEHGETRNGRYEAGFDRPWNEVTWQLILGEWNRYFYCSLFRRSMLREVGGYNGRMVLGLEDADLWVDLLRRGVRFAAIPEAVFNYRTRSDGMLQSTLARRDEINGEMRRHHA